MPVTCLVIDCKSRSADKSVSFFHIPAFRQLKSKALCKISYDRRQKWIFALNRDLSEKQLKHGRICSKHFISGKPAAFYDYQNPDWAPNQHLGYKSGALLKKPSDLQRYERTKRRDYNKITNLIEKCISDAEKANNCNNVSSSNLVTKINKIVTSENEESGNVEAANATYPEKLDVGVQTDVVFPLWFSLR